MPELRAVPASEPVPTFDDFWLLVVKKASKYEARHEWAKLSLAEQVEAMTAAAQWRGIWLQADPQYLLHPNRWLKYRRFQDELPRQVTVSAAAHLPAALPVTERGEMPKGFMESLRIRKANTG